jgi:cob(I)alamin adenosyltransferase
VIELLDALDDARKVCRRVERAVSEFDDAQLVEQAYHLRLHVLDMRDRAEELFFALKEPAA